MIILNIKNKKLVCIDPGKYDILYCFDNDNKENNVADINNDISYYISILNNDTKIIKYQNNSIKILQPIMMLNNYFIDTINIDDYNNINIISKIIDENISITTTYNNFFLNPIINNIIQV